MTRSDAGNYTCIASNGPQGEIRATIQLTVAGKHWVTELLRIASMISRMSDLFNSLQVSVGSSSHLFLFIL